MMKDGTWAGNMELQAASLVTSRNICIHMVISNASLPSDFLFMDGKNNALTIYITVTICVSLVCPSMLFIFC